ncbi:MAG: hypothetical protein ACI4AH_03150 [Muribaculaceae bacterium]
MALASVLSGWAQTESEYDDEEPIDLELVRKPVRRPGHAVITYITVTDDMAGRYAEVKQQKTVSSVAMSNVAVLEAMNKRAHQSQEEVEANVDRFIAEARAKAPAHETYVPDFAKRRIHDEEKMSQQQLLTSFAAKHTVGKTKYVPKSAPSMVEQNAVYLYFEVPTGSRPGDMNIRVQYYADDRLDIQSVEFLINGEKYLLKPDKLNFKKEGKYVSEWFDMPLVGESASLAEAMGYANYVRVKFLGKSCNHIKDLTRDQVSTLRKAYFLHKNYR